MKQNFNFKALTLMMGVTLFVAGCTSDATSVLNPGGSNASSVLTAEPGDTVRGQYFSSIVHLNDYVGKIFNKTASLANDSIIALAEGDAENNSLSYSIYATDDDGLRVNYFYNSLNNEAACSLPIIMDVSVTQNQDFPLPNNERFNLEDVNVFQASLFENIFTYEDAVNGDGWVVNGLNVIVLNGEHNFRLVTLTPQGGVSSFADYVHNAHPVYGGGEGFEEYLMDEEGNIMFDDAGQPLIKEKAVVSDNPRDDLIALTLSDDFNPEQLSTVGNIILKTTVEYDNSQLLTSFKDGASGEWWINVGKELINNPQFLSTAQSRGGMIGVASDSTLFVHTGDLYSGLNIVNPSDGSSPAILKDGSSLVCQPLGDDAETGFAEWEERFNEERQALEDSGVILDEFGIGGDSEVLNENR